MSDWTIGIPEHLAPFLSNILCTCVVSDHATKENKTKKGYLHSYYDPIDIGDALLPNNDVSWLAPLVCLNTSSPQIPTKCSLSVSHTMMFITTQGTMI